MPSFNSFFTLKTMYFLLLRFLVIFVWFCHWVMIQPRAISMATGGSPFSATKFTLLLRLLPCGFSSTCLPMVEAAGPQKAVQNLLPYLVQSTHRAKMLQSPEPIQLNLLLNISLLTFEMFSSRHNQSSMWTHQELTKPINFTYSVVFSHPTYYF